MKRMFSTLWLVLVVGLATTGGVAFAGEMLSAERLVESDRVLVIAHRGYSAVSPENTLPAFSAAVKIGADLIELDYHHTADDIPVVLHDDTLDRTTDATRHWSERKIRVGSRTLAELRGLDAGSWFDRAFAGTRIPTLAESLDTIQAGSLTLIERKGGTAEVCIALLREKGLLGQVVVQAFDWQYLADCHREAPDLLLGALGGRELSEENLDRLEASGAQIVGWHQASLDAPTIERIHQRGLRAWAWTVDDLSRATELIDAGVDGIITNVPSRMQALVQLHAAPSRAAAKVTTR